MDEISISPPAVWRIAPNVSRRKMGQPIKTCNVGHYGSTFHTHFYGQYLPKLNYGIKCPFTLFFSGRKRKRRGVSFIFVFLIFLSSLFFRFFCVRWPVTIEFLPFANPPPPFFWQFRKEERKKATWCIE